HFNAEPVFFNKSQLTLLSHTKYKDSLDLVMHRYDVLEKERVALIGARADTRHPMVASGSEIGGDGVLRLADIDREEAGIKSTIRRWLDDKGVGGDSNDTNYIFLRFVTDYLPAGLVGLLIAVIFLAAWGSIAATLNSLASCTIIDFHRRFARQALSTRKE